MGKGPTIYWSINKPQKKYDFDFVIARYNLWKELILVSGGDILHTDFDLRNNLKTVLLLI